MSTTWKCNYRRNKPGYPNQFEECGDEAQHMLQCSDPLFTAAIDVTAAVFYLPLGPASNQLYRNISGFFSVTGTTGTGLFPVRGATVGVVLNGYDANGASFPLINQNFVSDSNGIATGFFPCNGGHTMIGVSGIISYLSGNLTGVALINAAVTDMPCATFSTTTSATAGNIVYTVTNPINVTMDISVEKSAARDEAGWTVISTDNLAGFNTGPSRTGTIAAFQGYLYRSTFTPPYSTKAVRCPNVTGGAPPTPTGLQFLYSGNSAGWIPQIKVLVNSTYSGWYDGYVTLEYQPTGGGGWNVAGSLVVIANEYFLFDISSLTTAPVYDFRSSGCHYDSSSVCFWSDIISGRINITQIVIDAESSPTGCAIDVRWQSPAFASPYLLQIALNPAMNVGLTLVPGIGGNYYFHNAGNCNQIYYYRVQDANGFLSNVTSGSGRYIPPTPDFTLTQIGDSGINIDWSVMTETNVDYISGVLRQSNTPTSEPITGVIFAYGDDDDTVQVILNPLSTGYTFVTADLYSVYNGIKSFSPRLHNITLPPTG